MGATFWAYTGALSSVAVGVATGVASEAIAGFGETSLGGCAAKLEADPLSAVCDPFTSLVTASGVPAEAGALLLLTLSASLTGRPVLRKSTLPNAGMAIAPGKGVPWLLEGLRLRLVRVDVCSEFSSAATAALTSARPPSCALTTESRSEEGCTLTAPVR